MLSLAVLALTLAVGVATGQEGANDKTSDLFLPVWCQAESLRHVVPGPGEGDAHIPQQPQRPWVRPNDCGQGSGSPPATGQERVDARATDRMALGFLGLAPTPTATVGDGLGQCAPGNVPLAGGECGSDAAPSAGGGWQPESGVPDMQSDPWDAFADGYLSQGGPEEWLEHAYRVVTECEGSQWAGYYGTPYWSRAQFSADTWAKVTAITGLADPDAPFDTGANMAAWIGEIGIEAAGTTSGWPSCWRLVP